ncbi:MAG: hypothetical protein K940chlam9_00474 [Chlamydiae bacterium]|nr:hypothetical protein [Chlamydiota bacterium]
MVFSCCRQQSDSVMHHGKADKEQLEERKCTKIKQSVAFVALAVIFAGLAVFAHYHLGNPSITTGIGIVGGIGLLVSIRCMIQACILSKKAKNYLDIAPLIVITPLIVNDKRS